MKVSTLVNHDRPASLEGHDFLTFIKEDRSCVSFGSGGGDYWISTPRLSARFRDCGSGGGKSPETFMALMSLARTFETGANEPDCPLPLHHDFSIDRIEDDSGIVVTLSLNARNGYSITLERPVQGPDGFDVPCRESFFVAAQDCPPLFFTALSRIAYAMLDDNNMTFGNANSLQSHRSDVDWFPLSPLKREFRLLSLG
ncbi:MAG: hypothetical protein P4M15_15285 [Alphaproteobacteria bacterium]|nr:hypothetical protein [Alphaproteobacteria bacterium]